MKEDEKSLLLRIHSTGEWLREAAECIGMHHKRSAYLAEKWRRKGWYDYMAAIQEQTRIIAHLRDAINAVPNGETLPDELRKYAQRIELARDGNRPDGAPFYLWARVKLIGEET